MSTESQDAPPALGNPTDLGFDPEALRRKYREEREKRLRPDGNAQYVEVTGDFRRFVEDPYVEPGFERESLEDRTEVLVIGGGLGGLLAAARLCEAGIEDFRIVEKGGDFGGTWYWNRYPGAMCDVESYIYLPLLEELDYIPKEKYSRAPEILDHCAAIGRKYDLYRRACFQTEVTDMRWDDGDAHWIVSTNRGDRMRAHYVCMANGPLHRPKLPGIPGIESFAGRAFHTSRWDYDYTGGDSQGNLSGLRDKRVGIIGTGATAIQCVPHLGEAAKELYVFQRTPSSVDVRANRDTDPEWAKNLEPGWQARRMDNFNTLVSGGFQAEDLVNDGWTDIIRNLLFLVQQDEKLDLAEEALVRKMELADFQKMEEIRGRVESILSDPEVAEALKPYYRQFCKRPCFHDEYLQTFNRLNVSLVDTQGKGVERITPQGIVANGVEYPVDCLIYSTGFEVGTDYSRRCGYEIRGRDGLLLSEKWADGVSTLHGIHSRGLPNCFIMGTSQAGFTVNFPHLLSEMSTHIAYVIRHGLDNGLRTIEVSEEAEAEWVETIIQLAGRGAQFLENCTPGYYNNEGKPGERRGQDGFYGGGSPGYFKLLQDWRASGELPGLELR